ncbi:MAG: hypothetical protein CME59_09315 [Halioglobus sp.]|nr:hypothetical protein [Halioglobus sp.]
MTEQSPGRIHAIARKKPAADTGAGRRNRWLPCLLLSLGTGISSVSMGAPNPQKNVYFGEQHLHTSLSFDAFAFGNTLTGPEDFYRYARGRPIKHPGGYDVRITKPLDWGAVTEHTDYMGVVQQANDPHSPLRKSSGFAAGLLKFAAEKDAMLTFKALSASIATGHPLETLADPAVVSPVWQRIIRAADDAYEPGVFTSFTAFEWTSTPGSQNLHRNVFFRDSKILPKVPYSSLDSTDPIDLWRWMDEQRARGSELLAVSHNGNLSSGVMFPRQRDHKGQAIDRAWAEARLRNEPLTEVKQVKGQSETTPALSPNDEFAGYEVFVWQLLGATGAPQNYGSYVRQAYKDGLAMGQGLGFNPYRMGMVAGSDSHVTAVPYRQENFFGVHGTVDDSREKRLNGATVLGLNSLWVTPAGLSAVWAQENTREAIFDGLRNAETYATSGTRIVLRVFGGWEFPGDLLQQRDWLTTAYETGVPMGGELTARSGNGAPVLAIWATRDPDAANLDRIQVIKGWSKHGQSFEQVYDVAWAGEREPDKNSGRLPTIQSTVDLNTGEYSNTVGEAELKTLWTDPDFDPALDAFYYVRVLEIPTPRWSTIQAAQAGRLPPSGAGYTAIIQERAWGTPIWYVPDEKARRGAGEGLTVEQLLKQGGVALDNDALTQLVQGKSFNVRNRVTGKTHTILYGTDGRRLVTAVDGQPQGLSEMGGMLHSNAPDYEIRDGRLITIIAGTPLEITVYRLGDKYLAARRGEYGFVNYDVAPVKT